MLLLFLLCAAAGLIMLGLLPDSWATELSFRLPQKLGFFLYAIDSNMIFFGMLTLFGVSMAGFSLLKVVEFSRSRADLESLYEGFGLLKEWSRSALRLLASARRKPIPFRLGFIWKIGGTLAGIMFLVGLIILGTVYRLVPTVVQDQVKRQAFATAKNLSDRAESHLVKRNPSALHALLVKYSRLDGVAYVFVEDGKGTVMADRLGSFPAELQEMLATDESRSTDWRMVSLRGQAIYDVRVPILDGERGTAHVGIRKDSVDERIHAALFPLVTSIATVIIGGMLMVFFVVSRLSRPILQLAEVAHQMSNGDLGTPTAIHSRDEVGDLACSLERMRSSLKAAMSRLDRQPPPAGSSLQQGEAEAKNPLHRDF
jgi:HAMP domain-containing protein